MSDSEMYWIQLLNERDLQRIVDHYNIPFIFVRKKEKIVIHDYCLYWYKPYREKIFIK